MQASKLPGLETLGSGILGRSAVVQGLQETVLHVGLLQEEMKVLQGFYVIT